MKTYVIFLGLLYSCSVCGQTNINDWKAELQKATHDSTRFKCYTQIATHFRPTNLDSAYFYLRKAEPLSNALPKHKLTVEYLLELGNYQSDKGEHLAAVSTFDKGKKIATAIDYKEREIYIESRFALNWLSRGAYQQATKLYLSILEKMTTKNAADSALKYRIYHNLSIAYLHLEDYSKSLSYVEKKLSFIQKDIEWVAYYDQKGMALYKMGKYAEAIVSLEKAIKIAKKIKSVRFEIIATANVSEIYRLKQQYIQARDYNLQIIALAKENGFIREEMVATLNLGVTYLGMKEYLKALSYFRRIIPYFKEKEQKYDLMKALDYTSQAYQALGDYKNAYQNHVEYLKVKEEIAGIEKQKLITELNAQYELTEKQKQIDAQELEHKIQEEIIRVEKRQKWLLIVLFSAALLFLVGALWNFWKKNKLSKALIIQKEKVEKQAIELTEINQSKDKLFAILAHDLRSPIANLTNSLGIWKNGHTNGVRYATDTHLVQVYHELENVQLILDNLLEWAAFHIRNNEPNLQPLSIKQIVAFIVHQFDVVAKEKKISIVQNIDNLHVLADEKHLQIILRNLVSNAIKFTNEGGFVRITTHATAEYVSLIIKDTGIGMTDSQLQNVFHYPTSQTGTQREKGTGIGLSLCKELVEKNHGHLHINSALGKGTEIVVELPILV